VTDAWRFHEPFLSALTASAAFCNERLKERANNVRRFTFRERRMKIAIVTDAWSPQVNGVVTTLRRTAAALEALGHDVRVFSPDGHRTIPCPTYPEIRLALWPGKRLAAELDAFAPDAIHAATEGPLGMAAARYCAARALAFTTSYHTQFPQYVRKRVPIPERLTYEWLRRHHSQARRTLVATEQQRRDLVAHGFRNVALWSRGVDAELFHPRGREHLQHARPIFAFLGRVAVEKNIEAFLDLDLPGTKVVIGDGPDRPVLESCYPSAVFVGFKFDIELAEALSSVDVLVFPSRTDTFGLVLLEAMACGRGVVAANAGAIPEIVTPDTGTLVAAGDAEALAEGIRGFHARDPDTLGRNARARAERDYSWSTVMRSLLGLYQGAVAAGSSRTPRYATP
jgi:glycosyltransferase involved in cell wall biosynthesis